MRWVRAHKLAAGVLLALCWLGGVALHPQPEHAPHSVAAPRGGVVMSEALSPAPAPAGAAPRLVAAPHTGHHAVRAYLVWRIVHRVFHPRYRHRFRLLPWWLGG